MSTFILRTKGALKIPNKLPFLIADDFHLGWGEYYNCSVTVKVIVILPLKLYI